MGIQSLLKQFKKHYMLLFGVVILMFITSITLVTIKSQTLEEQIVKKEFNNVRNSVKFGILEVNLLNFYYINEGMLAKHIEDKNALNLVRWIHTYKKRIDVDGGIIISKNGNLLAKTDFVKPPFNSKITSLINESLNGELTSSVEKVPVESFDEGLKFEFLKKGAYSTDKAKDISLSLLKAYPIYDENKNVIASFITIKFINGDVNLLDDIVGNIIYDEAGIIIDSGNVIKKEFIANKANEIALFDTYKRNRDGKDIVDANTKMIIIPLYGFDEDLNGALYVKLPSIDSNESLGIFYIQSIIFLLLGLGIFLYSLRVIKKTSEHPYKKMVSIIYKMSDGDFKFPLLSRFYLQSIFKDEFNALMKISKRATKNDEPFGKE